jgi:OPA family sugar phosphate sensor protein UhpC-like MFS transporter
MLKHIIDFYRVSPAAPCKGEPLSEQQRRLKRSQWSTFLSATVGYGLYYVCRLSLNVVKKPIVEEGIFSETELGIIGSVLFFTYAVGKLTNGFLADRSNINRFMSTGLLVTALVNLCLGFVHSFVLFAILWGISGWFQSMGAASCVVGLSRWFDDRKRGSFYGFWSASHNIGEALTFIVVASIVSALGWRYGFLGAGTIGLVGALIVWRFFHDSPQSKGLPAVSQPKEKKELSASEAEDFNRAQKAVLRNPAIWILALSSAFMYISRYAVNSWGVFYLEVQKGYTTLDASFIISVSSVCGIIGTMFSGVISDRLFGGRRNVPALIFGLMNVVALCLFLLVPGVHFWLDIVAMVLFGSGIGVLLCFLGGLMAVDIAPRNASGAALGIVGIASYIGAGLQDVMSGLLIEGNKRVVDGVEVYDFTYINWFWIGAALMSALLALLVWNAGKKNKE